MKQDRGLPADQDTERAILAAIILEQSKPNPVLLQAVNALKPADFAFDSHRKIFMAMCEIGRKDGGVDVFTLKEQLEKMGELSSVGGLPALSELGEQWRYARNHNIEQYCTILREKSATRQIIHACETVLEDAYAHDNPQEITARLQAHIDGVSNGIQGRNCQHVSAIAPNLCDRLIREFDAPGTATGLPTGVTRLDRALGGLVDGENIVIAGYTGCGKSALALNIAEVNCLDDKPVTFYSVEMDRETLLIRLAAKRRNIPQMKIRNKALSRDELASILDEITEIKRWPLWIDDRSSITPRELYASARMQAQRGARLFVVDYVQLLANNCPGHTIREQVNTASATVRAMSKDTRVPVLNLSQLSRPNEKATPRKPTIYDLKESGNIEQDAHSVVLLWREFAQDASDQCHPTGNDAMIIGKNRSGPLLEIPAEYIGPLMHWKERKASYVPELEERSAVMPDRYQ